MESLLSLFAIPAYSLGYAWIIYIVSGFLFVRLILSRRSSTNNSFILFFLICVLLTFYIFLAYRDPLISIEISRFYLGLGFFILSFSTIKFKSQLFIRSLYIFSLIEFFYIKLLGTYPPYILNHFNQSKLSVLARSLFAEDTSRLLGPALNSSVSSSLIAIILVLYARKVLFKDSHPVIADIKFYDLLLLAFVFFLSGSSVGFICLGLGLSIYLLKVTVRAISHSVITKSVLFLMLFILVAYLFLRFSQFGQILFQTKLSYSYFSLIFADKINSISISFDNSIFNFLFGGFGGNLPDQSSIGGDFVILDMLKRFGLIPFSIFFISLYLLAKKNGLQLSLLLLVVSSLHYGTMFNFVGQVFTAILFSLSLTNKNSSLQIKPMR